LGIAADLVRRTVELVELPEPSHMERTPTHHLNSLRSRYLPVLLLGVKCDN
jgi:hypothetical protein